MARAAARECPRRPGMNARCKVQCMNGRTESAVGENNRRMSVCRTTIQIRYAGVYSTSTSVLVLIHALHR